MITPEDRRTLLDSHPAPLLASASAVLLSALFALTGVGIALLGSALPAFLAHWSLSDRDGGLLLFCSWLGSALGALMSRGRPASSIARGITLVAVACLALVHAGRLAVFPLMLCYGLGLGITMTSISLVRSERAASRRTGELNRLNLLWALGALGCPTLAAHALVTSDVRYLFFSLALTFFVFDVWVVAVESRFSTAPAPYAIPTTAAATSADRRPALPVRLCLTSALVVGVEACLGGWLTTYVRRADHTVAGAVTATSAFWAGLLLSRLLHSTPIAARWPALQIIRTYVALVTAALLLLTLTRQPAALLVLAAILGFGLGPLYPLLLALVLPRFRGTRVFFFAGVGSAVLPWLTGVVSTSAGSLRAGLAIPCAAVCLLLLLLTRSMPSDL